MSPVIRYTLGRMDEIRISPEASNRLRELGVIALYLFGSHAQGVAGPRSDFDFAVLMDRPGHQRGDASYDALYDLLSPLCPRTLQNDVIDIVFLHDAGLELKMHVIRYGKVLFEADARARLRFEQQAALEYADFKPILDTFDRAILQRV